MTGDGSKDGISWKLNPDYSITVTGTATKKTWIDITKDPNLFPFKENVYDGQEKKGYVLKSGVGLDGRFAWDGNNGALFLFCTPEHGKQNYTLRPMITTVADKDRPYEPYEGQIITLSKPVELRRIGSTRDKLDRKDGVWGVWRKTKRITLGANIMKFTDVWTPGKKTRAYLTEEHALLDDLDIDDEYVISGQSNGFLFKPRKPDAGSIIADDIESCTFGRRYLGIRIFTNRLDMTQSNPLGHYLNKLYTEGRPIVIHGILEPEKQTFEPLPEADQKALNKLQSFNHVTYLGTQGHQRIRYVTENAQAIIDNLPLPPAVPENSVGTIELKNGAVTNAKIADKAVTGAKMADSTITAGKLASNAVSTAKVADKAITAPKMDFATVKIAAESTQRITLTPGYKTVLTAKVPTAGKYYIHGFAMANAEAKDLGNFHVRCNGPSDDIVEEYINMGWVRTVAFGFIRTLSAGENIIIEAEVTQNSTTLGVKGVRILAERVE